VDYNFFAPTAAGKALRLCEKKRKKNSSQSREGAKKGYFSFSVSLPAGRSTSISLRLWVSVYNEYFFH
jgi:hypothetical protein